MRRCLPPRRSREPGGSGAGGEDVGGVIRPSSRNRPAKRRQVVARQRVHRSRAGDRLRPGGHDPRRDRHRARARRAADGPVDTAGLRRRTKIAGTVAHYAQLRSERAARRADVALVVCDASEGVTSEDLRVAELAMKSGCATLVALNKWDVRETDLEDATARLHKRLRQRPPVIACSALTGRGVPKLLERAIELADRRASRIGTSELNRFVGDLVASRPPPAKARAAPAPLLRGAGRPLAAPVRDPGQRPAPDQPRVGVPPREPAPRGLCAAGRPAGDRLRAPFAPRPPEVRD